MVEMLRRIFGTCLLVSSLVTVCQAATLNYYSPYRSGGVNYPQFDLYSDGVRVNSVTSIVFQTKGKNDCHVLLKKDRTNYNSNVIEVVIGGWGNGQSVIRRQQQGSASDTHQESGILSQSTYRYFWISWASSCIKVGKGSTVGSSEFMSWCGLSYSINDMSISYGYGSDGYWIFPKAVNGGWSSYGSWTTCVCNSKSRTRSCTNPVPSGGGADCSGSATETGSCTTTYCPRSCADIFKSNTALQSGAYTIYNSANQEIPAYCSFSAGHGYTYISATNTATVNIADLYTGSLSSVQIRHRRSDGTQWVAKIEQISRYSSRALSVQYNAYTGYAEFQNTHMGTPYIYFGLLPKAGISHRYDTQGYKCEGADQTFTNCDGNPNSYFVFLANNNNQSPTNYGGLSAYMQKWQTMATQVTDLMPANYFYFMEMHMGGCGGYITTSLISEVTGATLGVSYDISCSAPETLARGSKSTSDGSYGTTVTYTCNSGYTMISGSSQRTCSGTWSGTLPVCGVNGGWTAWTGWDTCSKTCASGSQGRSRSCTNPSPQYGGADCSGSTSETQTCNTHACPINGGWTVWTGWDTCSKTCASGSQGRSRSCTNPSPQYGGADCSGSTSETQTCNTHACPIDGAWSAWSSWDTCTQTCGTGSQGRTRSCTNPAPLHGGADCVGSTDDTQNCNTHNCPINGGWTAWTGWGTCSKTCASGSQGRSRSCTNPSPQYGGADCSGSTSETQTCNTHACPIDGAWSAWSSWDTCTQTCGSGSQGRTRSCTNPAPLHGGADCVGSTDDTQNCNTHNCPINGGWTAWTGWDTCSKTCASGSQGRSRSCTNPSPQYGGADCSGSTSETQTCNTHACPIDGDWTSWAAWTACSVTCSSVPVLQFRDRSCTNPPPQYNGADCVGNVNDTLDCNLSPCPVDGAWGHWNTYGSCSVTCLGGMRNRTRDCDSPAPAHGGADCTGIPYESGVCNTQDCNTAPPVDGNWGTWEPWQGCSVTCGTGVQRRYRACDSPAPDHGGLPCWGDIFEENSCTGSSTCPVSVDGEWGAWSSSASCSATCGYGRTMRVRYCNSPAPSNGGKLCTGDAMVLESCMDMVCPTSSGNGTSYSSSYVNHCPAGYFTCKAGTITCIEEVFRCDCMSDCDDDSDEFASWAGCNALTMSYCSSSPGIQSVSMVTLTAMVIAMVFGYNNFL